MTLSVLIPTYNYNCTRLVGDLSRQCDVLQARGRIDDYEIIVADDGSTIRQALDDNRAIADMPHARYIERGKNSGRAAMRNFLVSQSRGDYLLMLDQDGHVVSDTFVETFVDATVEHDVVCGRMIQSSSEPNAHYRLRYRYELRYEQRMTTERLNADPESPFRSFCFIIKREVALRVPMDESFRGYGYEDVYYGMQLRRLAGGFHHIDNRLQNFDLEPNPVYVEKTEEAMHTLYYHRHELRGGVRMLSTVENIRRMRLMPLTRLAGMILLKPLRLNLCSNHPVVGLFNIYKFLYYTNIANDE